MAVCDGEQAIEFQERDLPHILWALSLRDALIECPIERLLMGDGCFLRMRDTGRVTPEIIDTLVEHPWSHPCLEEQPRVHDHVLLTVNLAREVEHVISEQFPLVELGPGRRRQLAVEKCPPAGFQVRVRRQPLVGQD